jgi:hypothetical protein
LAQIFCVKFILTTHLEAAGSVAEADSVARERHEANVMLPPLVVLFTSAFVPPAVFSPPSLTSLFGGPPAQGFSQPKD